MKVEQSWTKFLETVQILTYTFRVTKYIFVIFIWEGEGELSGS